MTEPSRHRPALRQSDRFTDAYDHGRTVRVVVDADGAELVALKTGSNPSAFTAVEREALVLGQLRHPNVVELLRVERGHDTVTLVTRFAGRTTLARAQPADARSVARTGATLLALVDDLHAAGWVHGRIRPEHCIVGADGTITLCGFGAAHRAPSGDHRFGIDIGDAIEIVRDLAARLARPRRRRDRRTYRDLLATLDRAATGSAGDPAELMHRLDRIGRDPSPARSRVARRRNAIDLSERLDLRRIDADRDTVPSRRRALGPSRAPSRAPSHGPSHNARFGSVTAPPRRASRLVAIGAAFATLAGLLGIVVLLRKLGGPLLQLPSTTAVPRLDDLPYPVALALAVVRLAAFAACLYGVALSAAVLAAVLTRRADLAELATALAPRRFRATLVALIGAGLVVSLDASTFARVGSESAPLPSRAPTPTTTVAAPATDAAPATIVLPPPAGEPSPGAAADASVEAHASPLPRLWVIERGDHLWGVAAATLSEHLGRPATEAEIRPYWSAVIELNRDSLAHPDDPDLVHVGQVVELPPL